MNTLLHENFAFSRSS